MGVKGINVWTHYRKGKKGIYSAYVGNFYHCQDTRLTKGGN